MNKTKYIAFGLIALLIVTMTAATIVEQIYGTDFARNNIYTSPITIAAWGLCALCSLAYIIKQKSRLNSAAMLLHCSLAVILLGALTSHLTAKQGKLHLRHDEDAISQFTDESGEKSDMPFGLSLIDFQLEYYPGSNAPMDFISHVQLSDGNDGKISMNQVLSHNGYRFYQSSYDSDMQGATLLVAYDPYGIAITYAGYALLVISMLSFFFMKQSRFRALLRNPSLRTTVITILLCATFSAKAAPTDMPKSVSKDVAEQMGELYIYYNDRVCPLATFANDFTLKIYGSNSYRGLNAVQVVAGWLFYYDDWKEQPIIKIKESEARQLLGINGKYAALQDFFAASGYKLDDVLCSEDYQKYVAANEKFSLISTIATGSALRIYPVSGTKTEWYSPADKLPGDIDEDQWIFIRKSLNLAAQYIYDNDTESAVTLFEQIKKYQRKTVGEDALPSDAKFRTELIYNRLPHTITVGGICLIIGILGYIIIINRLVRGKRCNKMLWMKIIVATVLIYLSIAIAMRWYVSGHLPLSNGFETMQFMAWCCAALALIVGRKFGATALPIGLSVCGFALLVAGMGESNPQITQLMPVLASPLLSVHVMLIMMAYTLFAFVMFNGISAIIVRKDREQVKRLQIVSHIALYPAVFMLAIGIFIGAVWANQSWGTYWSWDPKETWALITMLIYTFPLHDNSVTQLRRPMLFHCYMIAAFAAVLMTYFGVNFILGGMHSYAG